MVDPSSDRIAIPSNQKATVSNTSSDSTAKSWSIRDVPANVRHAAVAGAKRDEISVGEWITRAIIGKVRSDRASGRTPAVIAPPRALLDPAADLDAAERLIALAERLATISGKATPRSVTRLAHGVIRDRLQAARQRGLTDQPSRPTETQNSQTAEPRLVATQGSKVDGTMIPRCGDHVRHEPSGETWLVAYADEFVLAPAGWPDSRVQTAQCTITKRCTDEEHQQAVRQWKSVPDDSRTSMVMQFYGEA